MTESLQLMAGLVSILQHQSLPYIPLHVCDVLLTLHRPDNIELWDANDPLSAFWEISNQVLFIYQLNTASFIKFSTGDLLHSCKAFQSQDDEPYPAIESVEADSAVSDTLPQKA